MSSMQGQVASAQTATVSAVQQLCEDALRGTEHAKEVCGKVRETVSVLLGNLSEPPNTREPSSELPDGVLPKVAYAFSEMTGYLVAISNEVARLR